MVVAPDVAVLERKAVLLRQQLDRPDHDRIVREVRVGRGEGEPLVRDEDERVPRGEGRGLLPRVAAHEHVCVARLLVRDQPSKLAQAGERHRTEGELERGRVVDRRAHALVLLAPLPPRGGEGGPLLDARAARADAQCDEEQGEGEAAEEEEDERQRVGHAHTASHRRPSVAAASFIRELNQAIGALYLYLDHRVGGRR